jgi:hypothetical protein
MLRFLEIAKKGINMNLIAFCSSRHVYQSDSCPFGFDGYSNKGYAWQFEILKDLQFRASNNLLECIVSIVLLWADMLTGRIQRGNCALLMTNSSMLAGCLRKTNFQEVLGDPDPIKATARIEIARKHMTFFLETGIKGYSKWFVGGN